MKPYTKTPAFRPRKQAKKQAFNVSSPELLSFKMVGATSIPVLGPPTADVNTTATWTGTAGEIQSTPTLLISGTFTTPVTLNNTTVNKPIKLTTVVLTAIAETIIDFDEEGASFVLNHGADTVFKFLNIPAGVGFSFPLLRVKDNSATPRALSLAGTIGAELKYSGGADLPITQAANAQDYYNISKSANDTVLYIAVSLSNALVPE